MNYPLKMSFKILAVAPQIIVRDANGTEGAVKRQGMRSLWKASYDVMEGDSIYFHIQEENAFVKFLDGCFGEIPVVGIFSGYIFNPAYLVTRPGGRGEPGPTVMRLAKEPAFLESSFSIEKLDPGLSEREERQILLSLMMVTLMERRRG